MEIIQIEQRTPEWFEVRKGIPTASKFDRIITGTGKETVKNRRDEYASELVAEIKGTATPVYVSQWMQWGIDHEDQARSTYEFEKDVDVKEVGFCFPDGHRNYGMSPDGLIFREFRGLEIKCPKPETLYKWRLNGGCPTEHISQVQGAMLISGFNLWDFYAYHPAAGSYLVTVEKDDKFCKSLEGYLDKFAEILADMKAANGIAGDQSDDS